MQLFFVLSGFLRRFYARRSLRIFPLCYLVVFTSLVPAVEPARRIVWWLLSYTFNIHMARRGWFEPNVAHFWSLSVEEQFYVAWPAHVALSALTLLIASLSWHLFEKPINALKRHFDEPLPLGIEPSARR